MLYTDTYMFAFDDCSRERWSDAWRAQLRGCVQFVQGQYIIWQMKFQGLLGSRLIIIWGCWWFFALFPVMRYLPFWSHHYQVSLSLVSSSSIWWFHNYVHYLPTSMWSSNMPKPLLSLFYTLPNFRHSNWSLSVQRTRFKFCLSMSLHAYISPPSFHLNLISSPYHQSLLQDNYCY